MGIERGTLNKTTRPRTGRLALVLLPVVAIFFAGGGCPAPEDPPPLDEPDADGAVPTDSGTDGDGVNDGQEVLDGTNPLVVDR